MKRFFDVLLLTNWKRRNYWIATGLVIIITSLAATWYITSRPEPKRPDRVPQSEYTTDPKAPAFLISTIPLAKGSWAHCWYHWYIVTYRDCTVLLQPGTTRDFNNWLKQGGAVAGALAIGHFLGALCGVAGLGLFTAICIVAGAYYAAQIIHYTQVAVNYKQCLRIRWSEIPWPGGPPQRFKIDNYGEWQRWIWAGDNRFWALPTPCKMYRDCLTYNPGGYGCMI